jgi:hypothetical protein
VRLGGRRWRTIISDVRLGGEHYRVIRPASPPGHAALYDADRYAHASVDGEAAADLAAAWWLAARSRHSLIHLPLRASPSRCGAEHGDRRLDLVLVQHSRQFPVHRWPAVRARLAATARPHTVTLPPVPFREPSRTEYDRVRHREFHDQLRWRIVADTLFVIGSRTGYELAAGAMRRLTEDYPAYRAAWPNSHCCAELDLGRTFRHDQRNGACRLHVQRCDEHS